MGPSIVTRRIEQVLVSSNRRSCARCLHCCTASTSDRRAAPGLAVVSIYALHGEFGALAPTGAFLRCRDTGSELANAVCGACARVLAGRDDWGCRPRVVAPEPADETCSSRFGDGDPWYLPRLGNGWETPAQLLPKAVAFQPL